ncbi:hypothetical protein [Micromonospora sp. CB01531]|uniref:hypothetical protein n=1 Tax=Micromonospora sp. CB01531 TaxID=1718947 RepID=UPI003FD4ADEF
MAGARAPLQGDRARTPRPEPRRRVRVPRRVAGDLAAVYAALAAMCDLLMPGGQGCLLRADHDVPASGRLRR